MKRGIKRVGEIQKGGLIKALALSEIIGFVLSSFAFAFLLGAVFIGSLGGVSGAWVDPSNSGVFSWEEDSGSSTTKKTSPAEATTPASQRFITNTASNLKAGDIIKLPEGTSKVDNV